MKKPKKRNFAKKVFTLPMVGIELGSCEFKSKSSNHWAVEANDENWHKLAQSLLLHITILYKETDWWKVRCWSTWTIDFNRKSNLFTSFGPTDACHVLMATFWHEFFSVCGASGFFQSGGGPWCPHNKHMTTNECHLSDEILVYIDFFCMHTIRIA